MQDMQTHLDRLRVQAAECEKIRDLTTEPVKRDLFARLAEHFKVLAGEVENAIQARTASSDTFLGRKTYDPFPRED